MTKQPDNIPPDEPSPTEPSPRGLEFYEGLLAWVEDGKESPLLESLARQNPLGLAGEKAFVRTVVQVVADACLVEFSPAQHARSLEALRETRKSEATPGWRRLVARLAGGTPEMPFAFRRGPDNSSAGRFKALYEVDEFELDLHLSEDGALIVQLISKREDNAFEGGGIALLQTKAGALLTSAIDENGEFIFSPAPRECIDLTLSLPNLEISIRDVDLLET